MGHILASDHGSALTVTESRTLARRVTVSQSWPPGSGNKQSEERPSPKPINPWGNGLDIPDARGGKVGCVASLKCQVAKRPDGFHRHKPLRSEGGWG
jgi:hypothetical protein